MKKDFVVKNVAGFTLVEMLVTVSLMILFSVAAATYNRSTDQQITLFREQGRLINLVYEARSLALTTYNRQDGTVPCGYGIRIASESQVILFRENPENVPPEGQCVGFSNRSYYSGDEEDVKVVDLKIIKIKNIEDMIGADLLFVPPDPKAYSSVGFPFEIILSAPRVVGDLKISVNDFGQITTE